MSLPCIAVVGCVALAERYDLFVQEYQPISGHREFNRLCQLLAFGKDSDALQQGRIVTVQSLSGSGALRVGAEFLYHQYPVKTIYIPVPTWANHWATFGLAGLQVKTYRYYKPSTCLLDYEVSNCVQHRNQIAVHAFLASHFTALLMRLCQ